MRIVNRKTFLALPAGTVFCKYTPSIFDALAIKGETLPGIGGVASDFYYQDLGEPWFDGVTSSEERFEMLDRMEKGEKSPPADYEFEGRDALFDEDQLFAVFDLEDVTRLVSRLIKAIPEGYGG